MLSVYWGMERFSAVRWAIVLAVAMGGASLYLDASTYVMGSFDPVSGRIGPCYTSLELALGVQPGNLRTTESWTAVDLLLVAAFELVRGLRRLAHHVRDGLSNRRLKLAARVD
jgi:hypothetical protein